LLTRLHPLNGRWDGGTVNVGGIAGGTRPNVVAERCSLEVGVRAVGRPELRGVGAAARARVRARGGRGGAPGPPRDPGRAGHDGRGRADGPLVADGEAGAVGPARPARPGEPPAPPLPGAW